MKTRHDIGSTNSNGSDLIDWFTLRDGVVCWITRSEAVARGFRGTSLRKLKPGLEGRPSGARTVHGRGSIVHCSGRRLLSVDILDALEHGMIWPWERGEPLRFDPASLLREGDKAAELWKLEGGALVWAVERHPSRPVGTAVQGAELSQPRGRFISSGGNAWLMDDVVHVLTHGAWPWQSTIFWD